MNRKMSRVHDSIQARCLVLEFGADRIAFVSADLIGLFRTDVLKIRGLIKSVPGNHVMVSATHTHSGPDTLGQWGPDIRTRGVDERWLAETRRKIASLVE